MKPKTSKSKVEVFCFDDNVVLSVDGKTAKTLKPPANLYVRSQGNVLHVRVYKSKTYSAGWRFEFEHVPSENEDGKHEDAYATKLSKIGASPHVVFSDFRSKTEFMYRVTKDLERVLTSVDPFAG